MAGSIGPGPGSPGGSSSADASIADLDSAIKSEGHTGDVNGDQPQERGWTGDVSPNQPRLPDPGSTATSSHGPEAGRAGTGPGGA